MSTIKRWNGSKWESLSNGNYVLQGGVSGNLIKEITLSSDTATVDFTGLNSLIDGDYTLECKIINVTSVNHELRLYVADSGGIVDTTDTNYKTASLWNAYTNVVTANASINAGIPTLQNSGLMSVIIDIKVINSMYISQYRSVSINSASEPFLILGCTKKNGTFTSITQLQIKDVTGVGIKAGSTFRLYGSNSKTNLVSYDPQNFSSLTSDRYLKPGEIAYIDYTLATSVPLRVNTVEGVYEIHITSTDLSLTVSNNNSIVLLPNNVSVSSIRNLQFGVNIPALNSTSQASTPWGWVDAYYANFPISMGLLISADLTINTYTKGKNMSATNNHIFTTSGRSYKIDCQWVDTTTVWSSLGTISFPFAQSGKIIIKRVI